jgi:hypothetical protein
MEGKPNAKNAREKRQDLLKPNLRSTSVTFLNMNVAQPVALTDNT